MTRLMIEIALDDKQELVRLKVFNNFDKSYSHWSFHKDDWDYTIQIGFILKHIMIRLNPFIENTLFFEQFDVALDHKNKIKQLVDSLRALKAPDSYDYYGNETQSDVTRYYENYRFEVNQSPYNDLEHFTTTVASMIINLLKIELSTRAQFEKYWADYDELKIYLKHNLRDMNIFNMMREHLKNYSAETDGDFDTYVTNGIIEACTRCRSIIVKTLYSPFKTE